MLLTEYLTKQCDSLRSGWNQRRQGVFLFNSMCHGVFIKNCLFFNSLIFFYIWRCYVLIWVNSPFCYFCLFFYFNFHLPNQCMKMCGHVCRTTLTHTPLSVSFHMIERNSKVSLTLPFMFGAAEDCSIKPAHFFIFFSYKNIFALILNAPCIHFLQ